MKKIAKPSMPPWQILIICLFIFFLTFELILSLTGVWWIATLLGWTLSHALFLGLARLKTRRK